MADENKHEDDISSHDFDGIKELDNKAPAWLILVFYVTIGFSLLYLVHYFGYPENGNDQASEYDSAIVQNQREIAMIKEAAGEKVEISLDQQIANGKKVFNQTGCVACHGALGQGASAPNLSDNFWIHGCSQENLTSIITDGNLTKGMPGYSSQLSAEQIDNVTTYILQEIVGSNPEGATEAKGEECK